MYISVILDLIDPLRGILRKKQLVCSKCQFVLSQHLLFFQQKKRTLERTETKQADSRFCFATKIITNCLLVFVNELFGDAMRVSKQ